MKRYLINMAHFLLIWSYTTLAFMLLFLSTGYSQNKHFNDIDTNEFIISPIFSGCHIKNIDELKTKSKDVKQWDFIIKTRNLDELERLSGLIKDCFSLQITCLDSCNLDDLFRILMDSTYNEISTMIINDSNNVKISQKLSRFRSLKSLLLNCLKLQDFPESVFYLDSLIELRFRGCKIRNIPEGISNLKNLKTIEFNDCSIEEISNDFSELENIEEISFNWCDKINIKSVCKILSQIKHKMKNVEFYECNINTFPKEIFLLTNASHINLLVNSISIEEINRINKEYPNIHIKSNEE